MRPARRLFNEVCLWRSLYWRQRAYSVRECLYTAGHPVFGTEQHSRQCGCRNMLLSLWRHTVAQWHCSVRATVVTVHFALCMCSLMTAQHGRNM